MKCVKTNYRGLSEQLQRKGFELLSCIGNDIDKPKEYFLWGNELRISPREKKYLLDDNNRFLNKKDYRKRRVMYDRSN